MRKRGHRSQYLKRGIVLTAIYFWDTHVKRAKEGDFDAKETKIGKRERGRKKKRRRDEEDEREKKEEEREILLFLEARRLRNREIKSGHEK